MVSPPKLGLLHSLARTGCTIVARHLGCMAGVALFSEIHPQGPVAAAQIAAATDPTAGDAMGMLLQAKYWHGLYPDQSREALRALNRAGNDLAIMQAVLGQCHAAGLHPVVRDWSFLDFHGLPFMQPGWRHSVHALLKEHYTLNRATLVRHPVAQYLSMLSLRHLRADYEGDTGLERYLLGYTRFLDGVPADSIVKFEDFLADRDVFMRRLSALLDVPFDPAYEQKARQFFNVTGDLAAEGRAAVRDYMVVLPRDFWSRITTHALYRPLIDRLGYDGDTMPPGYQVETI